MKQPRVTPISDGTANNSPASGEAAVRNNDLLWVDEVAALLPEELRLGWYRNVKPWISTLPPEDEVAHLAYSMGYLALLIRSTPALVAAERAKLAPVLQQLSKETNESLNSTAAYHYRLEERLAKVPAEVADGINTAEFVVTITKEVRNQFSKSGLQEAGSLLKKQGEQIRTFASEQAEVLRQLRYSIDHSTRNASDTLEAIQTASCRAKASIELWNREMRWVQWVQHGLMLLIGLFLGCLFYWWISSPPRPGAGLNTTPTQASQPAPSVVLKKSAPAPE